MSPIVAAHKRGILSSLLIFQSSEPDGGIICQYAAIACHGADPVACLPGNRRPPALRRRNRFYCVLGARPT